LQIDLINLELLAARFEKIILIIIIPCQSFT